MSFGLNEPKITQGCSIEKIKDGFNKPFDETRVLNDFNAPIKLGDGYFQVYSDIIDQNVEYQICIKKLKELEKVIFHLFDSASKTSPDSPVANFIFTKELDEQKNVCWNLHHRIVSSKDIGVSATDFLKKAVEYFEILKKNNNIEGQKFVASVSQPSVLSWFQKNGFTFSKSNTNDPSESLELNNGRYTPKENYETIVVKDSKTGEVKDPYLVKSKFFSNLDFNKKYIKEENGERFFDLREWINEKFTDDFRSAGFVPEFKLEKDI